MHPGVWLALAYLLGSIPAAYIAGKLLRGIDLREHGSRNLGATNVYRIMGWKVAVPVLAFDMAKGAIPVLLFPPLTASTHPERWAIAYGISAIVGHVRPIFLMMRGGGKGVATASGVFLALVPLPALIATGVFIVVLLVWGYVSLGSLAAATVLPLIVLLQYGVRSPLLIVSTLVAMFVFWTHRGNIERLRRGEEPRLGRSVER